MPTKSKTLSYYNLANFIKSSQILLMICFSLFVSSFTYAQKSSLELKVKNLKNEIQQAKGSQKLILLDSLCYLTRDMAKFKYDSIVKETVSLAIQLDSFDVANRQAARLVWSLTNRLGNPKEAKAYSKLLARFYLNGGDSYYFSEDVEKAIEVYDIASSYALKAGDSILYGISRKYIADAHTRMGNLVAASQMLKEVEDIYIKIKDTIKLVNTKSSRADLYSMNGFYDEAKIERNEAITLSKKIKYESGLLSALYNASIDNFNTGNYKAMISNLNQALAYARNSKEIRDRYEPQLLNKLLQEYAKMDSIEKATVILKEIQENPERNTKGFFEDLYHKSLSYYYLSKKELPKALVYAEKHYNFHISKNTIQDIMAAHELLFEIHEAMGNAKKALFHYKEATKISDSILSLKRTKALSYYQTLYETEKRDATIASQESEITILDSKNKIKQQWMLFGGIGLFAIFLIIYLIRSNAFAKKEQQLQQQLQQQFSHDLIKGQEEERSRIARELHDSVGQKLMLLSKQTKKTENTNMQNLANSTLEEVRSISRGLHPSNLERLGLTESINALVYDINANTDIFFTENIENVDNILSKESELHLYRIIQESLSNIVKHSGAKAVKLHVLKEEEMVSILIDDNGKGFDVTSKQKSISLGLKTLFERARIIDAILDLQSNLGKGTKLTVSIPIKNG